MDKVAAKESHTDQIQTAVVKDVALVMKLVPALHHTLISQEQVLVKQHIHVLEVILLDLQLVQHIDQTQLVLDKTAVVVPHLQVQHTVHAKLQDLMTHLDV